MKDETIIYQSNNAQWGKSIEQGFKGNLYLTNKRLIFEEKKSGLLKFLSSIPLFKIKTQYQSFQLEHIHSVRQGSYGINHNVITVTNDANDRYYYILNAEVDKWIKLIESAMQLSKPTAH